jgi:hypothetical protein
MLDLTIELERLTDPGMLRRVKVYSPDEIRLLQESGKITPIDKIRQASELPRVSVPDHSCRGSHGR